MGPDSSPDPCQARHSPNPALIGRRPVRRAMSATERVGHDGRETAYRRTDYGAGPTVCYVHGAGGNHQVWVHQYGDRRGPPAVAVDLSGHGDSDDVDVEVEVDVPAGTATLDAYADDVVATCEATDATVLCGHSMGGAVSLWVALERDLPLEGLVLCDTGAKLGVDDALLEQLADDFDAAVEWLHAEGMFFAEPDADLVAHSEAGLRRTGREVTLRDFETCDAFDVRDRLQEVAVPALAVCGERDRLTPPAYHEYLSDELPDCKYRTVTDAAHMPMLERPDAFNETIRSFLV